MNQFILQLIQALQNGTHNGYFSSLFGQSANPYDRIGTNNPYLQLRNQPFGGTLLGPIFNQQQQQSPYQNRGFGYPTRPTTANSGNIFGNIGGLQPVPQQPVDIPAPINARGFTASTDTYNPTYDPGLTPFQTPPIINIPQQDGGFIEPIPGFRVPINTTGIGQPYPQPRQINNTLPVSRGFANYR